MFDTLLADGIVSGVSDKLAAFVVKCLAVAGGFLIGYFLGGMVAWALDRWVFAEKAPAPVKKAIAWVAAVALALIIALIVFGEGGEGLFGRGGGSGDGKGAAQDDKGKTPPAPDVKETPPKKKDEVKPPSTPTPGDMRVTILAGDEVKDGRFYLIDGDPTPKNLAEFKEAVLTRRKEAKPELRQVIFRFKSEKLSQDHPAVRNVVTWLSANGIGAPFE